MAPEILHNVPYGTKVDMWALGVISYTLIGGVPPFYAPTNQATFQRILKAEVKFEDHLWGHVHEDCKEMIRGYVFYNLVFSSRIICICFIRNKTSNYFSNYG